MGEVVVKGQDQDAPQEEQHEQAPVINVDYDAWKAMQEAEEEDDYFEAPDVEQVALELIKDHHQHLVNAKIGYMFRNKDSWTSGGRQVLAKTYRMSGRHAARSGLDFEIVVDFGAWCNGNAKFRRALVDHELTHCDRDMDGNFKVIGHDFEGFASVIKRHGLWTDAMREAKNAMNQTSIFELEEDTGS